MRLQVRGPAEEVSEGLRQITGIRSVEYASPHHIVEYALDQEPQASITELTSRKGWTLLSMESAEMSLEDIFLHLTVKEDQGR